jgi:hypothetical protein
VWKPTANTTTLNEAGIGIAFVTDPWGTNIEINERPPQ